MRVSVKVETDLKLIFLFSTCCQMLYDAALVDMIKDAVIQQQWVRERLGLFQ